MFDDFYKFKVNCGMKKYNKLFSASLTVMMLIFFVSCGSNNTIAPDNSGKDTVKVSNTIINLKYQINLFSIDTVDGNKIETYLRYKKTGFNQLIFRVTKNGAIVPLKDIKILYEMAMMSKKHSCPTEPIEEIESGIYSSEFYTVMPGNDKESWSFNLDLTTKEGTKIVLKKDFDIRTAVPDPDKGQYDASCIANFTYEGVKYFMFLNTKKDFIVLHNDYILKVCKKDSDYSWPNVDDLEIEAEPWMDSMGHGSVANIPPVSIGNGFYKASLNFSMLGDWQVLIKVKKDGIIIKDNIIFYHWVMGYK